MAGPGIDFDAVEDALRAWVMAGTGLAPARVVLADGGSRPEDDATPYVSISGLEPLQRGMDGRKITDNPASVLGDGQEIKHTASGIRQLDVRFQCFGGTVEGSPTTGNSAPVAMLAGVVAARSLPTASEALQAAGVGVGAMGKVQWLPGSVGGGIFEARAVLDVTCYVGSEVSEFTTFIQKTRITPTINEVEGDEFEVDGGA